MNKNLTKLAYCCAFIVFAASCHKKDNNSDSSPVIEAHVGDSIKVNFPPGSITSGKVSIKTVNDSRIVETFNETKNFYLVDDNIIPYQIVLNIGQQPPLNDSIFISIRLSDYFKSLKPGNNGFELFAQSREEGGMEVIDLFTIMSSKYNFATSELGAYLPIEYFTNARTADKTYEAILMIGTTPGENLRVGLRQRIPEENNVAKCDLSQITCPLSGGSDECVNKTTSPYGWRVSPKKEFHRGIDYGIPVGTNVYSAADGIVEIRRESITYGNIIFLRHTDKTATLYAHLSAQLVNSGQKIKRGTLIGKSGGAVGAPGAGTSTGPHLHFEFYPFGENYAKKRETDPFPCITDGNIDGAITVRDNGNFADDAFELYLGDNFLGATEIGASNSIAANNLRPGIKILKLKCIIAPDDEGTYEVLLNDGLTFSYGGIPQSIVVQSGVLRQGETISWEMNIPNTHRKINNSSKMKMNTVLERKK